MKLADRLVFAAVRVLAVLRHPLIAHSYWRRRGRIPNFAQPADHGEMVQWRKVFDHNPQFIVFTDKLGCKRWVAEHFPDVPLVPTLWEGERPEDLPDAFVTPDHVIKASHGWRTNHFPHLRPLGRSELNRRMEKWLRRSYVQHGQWAYRHAPRRLFVEPRLDRAGRGLWEYGIRAHDGEISGIFVVQDHLRPTELGADFTADGLMLPARRQDGRRPLPADFVFPDTLLRARDIASRLSRGFDHLRVDFLVDGDTLYLGEITVYPGSGFGTEWKSAKGKLIEEAWFRAMHLSWFYRTPQPWPLSIYQSAFRRWVDLRRHENASPAPTLGSSLLPGCS